MPKVHERCTRRFAQFTCEALKRFDTSSTGPVDHADPMASEPSGLILRGGRVVDPGAGLDVVTDVLVRDGLVADVGDGLVGSSVLDVSGLVVGPGFVDLHSHVHSVAGHRLQALDGVTTALDLEAGVMPVARGYADAALEGRPLNYGFSASWSSARGLVLAGIEPAPSIAHGLGILSNEAWQRSSTPRSSTGGSSCCAESSPMARSESASSWVTHRGPIRRNSWRSRDSAAEAGVGTYTHVRELVEADPTTPIDGTSEITIVAAETGHRCTIAT